MYQEDDQQSADDVPNDLSIPRWSLDGLTIVQSAEVNDSNVRPPVTPADLEIARRARKILHSRAKWNRAGNRECPPGASTVSFYCALERATIEVTEVQSQSRRLAGDAIRDR